VYNAQDQLVQDGADRLEEELQGLAHEVEAAAGGPKAAVSKARRRAAGEKGAAGAGVDSALQHEVVKVGGGACARILSVLHVPEKDADLARFLRRFPARRRAWTR
jgi:hypothetical protein